jgi:hypothetical protein
MPQVEDGPLALASVDELVDELKRRHDCGIVRLEKDLSDRTDSRITWYWGGLSRCMGGAKLIERKLLSDDLDKSVEADSDYRRKDDEE